MSNSAILSFWKPWILIFEKIPHLKVLEISKTPKFWQSEHRKSAYPGLYNTSILWIHYKMSLYLFPEVPRFVHFPTGTTRCSKGLLLSGPAIGPRQQPADQPFGYHKTGSRSSRNGLPLYRTATERSADAQKCASSFPIKRLLGAQFPVWRWMCAYTSSFCVYRTKGGIMTEETAS